MSHGSVRLKDMVGHGASSERSKAAKAYALACAAMARASVLISEAQGMCSDRAPHEEINVVLDRAQRALDS